ncbi:MAG: carboxypeptidase M32 [Planctomycetales bacterium]|nr:carboxypeptidase M32 [Planctomycetales bacterium]
MASAQETFDLVCKHVRETALLESAGSLLEWDERTRMPIKAGAYRAEQIAYVSRLAHERRIDRRLGEWLGELAGSELAADPHSDHGATVRQLRRDYEKKTKLPVRLVEELTRASVLGQQAWVEARKNDDFAAFAPHLTTILNLKREQAEAIGYEQHIYDALLDDFEPDAKTAEVAEVLSALKQQLAPLVAAIAESGRRPPVEILERGYPASVQESFGTAAAARIGFDFDSGRLDETAHPFCTSLGPNDCRITTRYDERFFPSAFFGILHEAGHGIYDQGLRGDWYGLPPGSYISLGIHESQSRMWENAVGRSSAFWRHFYPEAQRAFPAALGDVSLDDFYFAINNVEPSLIRVEADEATYNLHIIVRFELEQALLTGDLSVADLPDAWRGKYREALGIQSPDDADGVLQDIHWSAALIGYFPTYSLGNLYMAQFFAAADRELGGLDAMFERGEFLPLRDWLRRKIHEAGQCYSAAELVERVTGQPLSHAPLIDSLRQKLAPLYGLD